MDHPNHPLNLSSEPRLNYETIDHNQLKSGGDSFVKHIKMPPLNFNIGIRSEGFDNLNTDRSGSANEDFLNNNAHAEFRERLRTASMF